MNHLKFHLSSIEYALQNNSYGEGNAIIREQSFSHCFDYVNAPFKDIQLYQSLRSEKFCIHVDISKVICMHSFKLIRGVQVVYRSTFEDNTTRETTSPFHFMNRGFYTYGHSQIYLSEFELEAGEHLIGVSTRQGDEVIHAIQLVTNRRVENIGSYGNRERHQWLTIVKLSNDLIPDLTRRIIAFVSVFLSGALHRIGYYSVSMGEDRVFDFNARACSY